MLSIGLHEIQILRACLVTGFKTSILCLITKNGGSGPILIVWQLYSTFVSKKIYCLNKTQMLKLENNK